MATYNFTPKRNVEVKSKPHSSGGFVVYLYEKSKYKFVLNHVFKTLSGAENMVNRIVNAQRINTTYWN